MRRSSQMVGVLVVVAVLLFDHSQCYTVHARPRGSSVSPCEGATSTSSPSSSSTVQQHFTSHSPTAAGRRRLKALSRPQIEDDDFEETVSFSKIKQFTKHLIRKRKEPGTLMLVRCGDSVVRDEMTFTGWIDVDLADDGIEQMKKAARLLTAGGYTYDVTYTSRLKRAIRSAWTISSETDQKHRPVYKSWRLNERMYGALEGLSKPVMAKELGEEVVQKWRRSLLARPPPMANDHKHWHGNDRKYMDLVEENMIPNTESLQDTMERTLPLWNKRIIPLLQDGQNVLIIAHGNSLRGIVKHIDNLSPEQIQSVNIPSGIPLVYKFERSSIGTKRGIKGRLITRKRKLRVASMVSGDVINDKDSNRAKIVPIAMKGAIAPLNGEFLGTKKLLDSAREEMMEREEELAEAMVAMSLALENRNLDNSDDQMAKNSTLLDDISCEISFSEKYGSSFIVPAMIKGIQIGEDIDQTRKSTISSGPLIVMCRHGKTTNNNLGLFTGWEDAPLSEIGRQEATAAGKLLNAHNVQFDVMYTSWLSRAIETGWRILDEMDQLWLPIIKSWRLNERMYGALTNMSKQRVQQLHGSAQFVAWRRGYTVRPPPVTSFSEHYPGNEERYVKYVKDTRVSLKESFIRSLSAGKLEVHKKFPKTESLKDCMDRTIPFFKKQILEPAIRENTNVLITTHENAIRGLLMHLCDIPEERIAEVEIPTGLPLVYNVEKKCVQLLDDGTGLDPVERYDFGKSPELLFAPCDIQPDIEDMNVDSNGNNENNNYDNNEPLMCFIGADGRTYSYDPVIRFVDDDDVNGLHMKSMRRSSIRGPQDGDLTDEKMIEMVNQQVKKDENYNV